MRFRILGPLAAVDGAQQVRLGASKPRALLGALLLHANEVVSTARLVDELWGEQPPATADKLVQGYVHALRKQLDPDTLVTQAPGYLLRVDPEALDLLEFQRLTREARSAPAARAAELRRQALELWRGPPLADVVFEGPARHEVGQLSELHVATRIELLEAELELGHHSRLVGELEMLVAAHPYQERLRELLMLALYRSGRQAEALQAYKAARRMLSDELGLEPGQALRELEAAILRQDDALSGGALRSTARDPGTSVSAGPATPPARGDELRPVTALFADIVGSTALGERLPPEDVKALVGECVTQMSKAVEEYGGTVQAYEGDGICAYFGVPQAHEDDPERAARTALRILEVVGEYARDIADAWAIPDFAVRVGINTGRAGVGTGGRGKPADGCARRHRQRRRPAPVGSGAGDDRRGRCDRAPARPSVRVRAARRAHRQGSGRAGSSLAARRPDPNRCSSAPPAARRPGGRAGPRAIGPGRLRVRSGPGHPFPRRARHRKDAHAGGAAVVPTG